MLASSTATSTAAMAPPSSMPAPASSSRSRNLHLVGSFDLPAGWGSRRPMGFCKDLLISKPDASEPHAGGGPQRKETTHSAAAPAAAKAASVAPPSPDAPAKPWNLRGRKAAADVRGGDAKSGCRFSASLSMKEIEKDFLSITGRRPPRRPRRRPKNVQKHIDTLYPELSMSQVKRDSYRFDE